MSAQDFEAMRRAMVASQLRTTDVSDPAVVAAMAETPRERFVPEGYRAVAYNDRSIPVAPGRALSPPLATGLMLQAARPGPATRALVIGAGTGYAAAVLARLAGSVIAVESDADLAAGAAALLGESVAVVTGPLADGHGADAPYDLVLIDGAVEQVPPALTEQLADGGMLVTGIVEGGITRIAAGTRHGGAFGLRTIADSEVAPLPGFSRPAGFRF